MWLDFDLSKETNSLGAKVFLGLDHQKNTSIWNYLELVILEAWLKPKTKWQISNNKMNS